MMWLWSGLLYTSMGMSFKTKDEWEIRLDGWSTTFLSVQSVYCVCISTARILWKKSRRLELQFRIPVEVWRRYGRIKY